MSHGVAAYPLYWPLAQPRTTSRRAAGFQVDFVTARDELFRELRLLGARDVLVSTNVPLRRDGLPMVPDREPGDPGVAVYFSRAKRPYVIACDAFTRIRWNVRAVGLTVEALRAIARHGATSMLEQAFSGFAALPPAGGTSGVSWREILGVPPTATLEQARAAYRELARTHHPDVGGTARPRPMLRLVEGGFVGQDWPSNGERLAQRVLNLSELSADARCVLKGLIDGHGEHYERMPGARDVFIVEELRFLGVFAFMKDLEKVRAALRELHQAELVRVEFLDAFRSREERVRIRFDYGAIAERVGMGRTKQHNAPCASGFPGLAKVRDPDEHSDPPFEPIPATAK